jgi:hypothetical protein
MIEVVKPAIRGALVTNPSPDALLWVEAWRIGRKILQMQTPLFLQKLSDQLAFVPPSTIHIEPDGIASQTNVEMSQHFQKTLGVSLFGSKVSLTSQQRGYPAGDIKPLPMLAGGGDPQASPSLGPSKTQSRVEGKAGLVLQDHRFIGL